MSQQWVQSNTACKNFLEKWKPPYLVHPKQQLQACEITVAQLACEPQYWHRGPKSMESARVDQSVTTIGQCPAGRLKQLFSPLHLCLPVLQLLLPCPSPPIPCSQYTEDLHVFGSWGASAPTWLRRHPVVVSFPCSDDLTIAMSRGLPTVMKLENINQAHDGNLAFSVGDVIEMSFRALYPDYKILSFSSSEDFVSSLTGRMASPEPISLKNFHSLAAWHFHHLKNEVRQLQRVS